MFSNYVNGLSQLKNGLIQIVLDIAVSVLNIFFLRRTFANSVYYYLIFLYILKCYAYTAFPEIRLQTV